MKTMKWMVLSFAVSVVSLGFAENVKKEDKKMSSKSETFAKVETSQGSFTIKFFPKNAPKTVDNFVGLAEGTKEFIDPKTGQAVKRPFYDGLTFHRIIDGFMIQGGCPLGTGTGGPGYKFEDEYKENLKFDRKGILAMANSGPNTNGSQFFVTVANTHFLNYEESGSRYTIFGEVIEGYDVVEKIGKVATTPGNNKPLTPVTINSVKIVRK